MGLAGLTAAAVRESVTAMTKMAYGKISSKLAFKQILALIADALPRWKSEFEATCYLDLQGMQHIAPRKIDLVSVDCCSALLSRSPHASRDSFGFTNSKLKKSALGMRIGVLV